MGGNAITYVKTSRLSKAEHKEITDRVLSCIPNTTPSINYPDKDSFGDVDIYITIDNTLNSKEKRKLLEQYITTVDGIIESIVINKNIFSFAIQYDEERFFQVDLYQCENREYIQFFYAFGFLSQIIYKMLSSVNLVYNQKGLFLDINQRTVKYLKEMEVQEFSKEILITKDQRRICEILGLSYSRFQQGFHTKEEIFIWLSETLYYRRIYRKEFGKLQSKIIDDLIDFQDGKDIIKKYESTGSEIERLIDEYNLRDKLESLIATVCRASLIKKKFNFQIFLDVGFTKSELGNAMRDYKLSKGENFDNFIVDTSDEDIIKDINTFKTMNDQVLNSSDTK